MRKSLFDLSWQVDEETYRANPAISYSILSTFARGGHTVIPHLFDKKDSEALRFGGLVDTLRTDPEAVSEKFFIADFPSLTDAITRIVKSAFTLFGETYRSLELIPFNDLFKIIEAESYYPNWKPETRVNDIIKKGTEYYNLLYLSGNKIIMSNEDYQRAKNCVDTLGTHSFTKDLFFINPFDKDIEKHYQFKFILENESNTSVKCMFDLLIVNHADKTIQPCDLKTTGKDESSFEESFLQWRYDLQATLYSYILARTIEKDEYFKDFKILPFRFIVINAYNLTPLVWEFKYNHVKSDWKDNKGNIYKGWRSLLKELLWHLNSNKYEYSVDAYSNEGILPISNLMPYDERTAPLL